MIVAAANAATTTEPSVESLSTTMTSIRSEGYSLSRIEARHLSRRVASLRTGITKETSNGESRTVIVRAVVTISARSIRWHTHAHRGHRSDLFREAFPDRHSSDSYAQSDEMPEDLDVVVGEKAASHGDCHKRRLQGAGVRSAAMELPGLHHFSVIDALGDAKHDLHRAVVRMISNGSVV
jgi:hypothetical protein